MKPVDLGNLENLPSHLRQNLQACDRYFLGNRFLEEIRDEPAIRAVIEEINSYCASNMVVGYHHTRAIPEDLLESGLTPRSGEEIRNLFLERFGTRFSESQLGGIKAKWALYYDEKMRVIRDNRIYFNFAKKPSDSSGIYLLLKNYGGEQIYFCIDKLPGVGDVLSSIGEPLVARCALLPAEVKIFGDQPWGEIATSSYHCMINPDAHQVDRDGHQLVPVPPERIELIRAEH